MIDVKFGNDDDFVCDFSADETMQVGFDAPSVIDVQVNGTSVVNEKNVAEVIVPTTAEEVHALPDTTPIPVVPTDVSAFRNDAGYITSKDIPPVPTELSEFDNDVGFITEDDVPTELKDLEVTDNGEIDLEEYDWDIETYLNTIKETGMYKFSADGIGYFLFVESLVVDDVTFVYQEYWGTEEGPKYTYPRFAIMEDGEVIDSGTMSYLSTEEAYMNFATKIHMHIRYEQGTSSVWSFVENTLTFSNENPLVIYADTKSGQSWLIEGFFSFRTPNERLVRVSPMFDGSVFYQRSGHYVNRVFVWDANWYKFAGEVFTP